MTSAFARLFGRGRSMIVVFLLPWIVVGCGAPGGTSSASKPVLLISAADPCAQYRDEFAKSKSYFTDEIIKNVGTGAVIGGLVGAGVGVMIGSPLKGAAIGAGLGAAAGGAKSYLNLKEQDHKDAAELAQSVNADLGKEGDEIDHTKASFARLRKCRFDQAVSIKNQVRARQIDRAAAQGELMQQKAWFNEEIALAKDYKLTMEKRGAQFKEAADEISKQESEDAAKAAAARAQAQAAQQAADTSIPNKRDGFSKDIASAEANSEAAFNLDSNKKVVKAAAPAYG